MPRLAGMYPKRLRRINQQRDLFISDSFSGLGLGTEVIQANMRCHPGLQDPSVQISSVAQSCPTPCDPMNRSTPGLPVHHHLPEFTQTHVHRVSDAIQSSHPLSSPSPPAPNLSLHQSPFQ